MTEFNSVHIMWGINAQFSSESSSGTYTVTQEGLQMEYKRDQWL
jgi:hypothetical protein